MKQCKSGRLIKRKRRNKEYYYLRLNLIDLEECGKKRYSILQTATDLEATNRNYLKASALLDAAISEYNCIAQEVLFHVYCKKWVEQKKNSIEVTTYDSYVYRIQIIDRYFIEHPVPLKHLTAEMIQEFYYYLLSVEHGIGMKRTKGYSNRSIKDVAALINMILNDAVALDHISKNPAAKVKRPKRVEDIKLKGYISADDVKVFLDAIRGHRLEVPFLMGLVYGLRREEIIGLKWSSIHNDGKLYIEHTISQSKTLNIKNRVKTSSSYRAYPISNLLMKKLVEQKHIQEANRLRYGEEYIVSDYMFTWEDGRHYMPDYITKAFKKLVRCNPDLDDNLTLHSLRASCVSILIHEGIDIKDIQEWVGHKDIQTTLNIYAQVNEKEKDKVNQKMSKILLEM